MERLETQLTDNERQFIVLIRQLIAKVGEEKAGTMLCQLFVKLKEHENAHSS